MPYFKLSFNILLSLIIFKEMIIYKVYKVVNIEFILSKVKY